MAAKTGDRMNRKIHTPEGVRDVYGKDYTDEEILKKRINDRILSYGYEGIRTPTFEFFDVFSKEIGTTPSRNLYKFFDREGNTLVLRPDFTPSIGRLASILHDGSDEPLRFTYSGNVFVNRTSYKGQFNESTEVGCELINDSSVEADAEIISLAKDVLESVGFSDFIISVGHADFLGGLIKYGNLYEDEEKIRDLILNKNFFGLDEFLGKTSIEPDIKKLFKYLPKNFTSISDEKELIKLSKPYPVIRTALERMIELESLLKLYDADQFVTYDFSLISKRQYYTGVMISGYTYGSGEPILSGGRYDNLLHNFGFSAPAIGFAIFIDSMMTAVRSQGISFESERKSKTIEYTDKDRDEKIREAIELRAQGVDVKLNHKG